MGMRHISISLKSFSGKKDPEVSVNVESCVNKLKIGFRLNWVQAKADGVAALLPPGKRIQKSGLWNETCFEFFWRFKSKEYYELNVSPAGHWQIYSFYSYRNPNESNPIQFRLDNLSSSQMGNEYRFDCELISSETSWIEMSSFQPTAILQSKSGLEYFAPSHPTEKPDFHRMDHWIIL